MLQALFDCTRWLRIHGMRASRTRRARQLRRGCAALLLLALAGFALLVGRAELPAELQAAPIHDSAFLVTDRGGKPLREVRAGDGTRAAWISRVQLGPRIELALIAAEDRRFYLHPGVDPLATLRALATSLRAGRVVSGSSTLSMQLARMLRPRPRNAWGKLQEAALAVRIELALPKDRIVEEYMNRVPVGPQLRGVAAASYFYVGKPVSELSWAEAALLAGLPRGPALYAVRRHPARARRRRDRVLARLLAAESISHDEYARALAEPLPSATAGGSFGAPHFVSALVGHRLPGSGPQPDPLAGGRPTWRTSLDSSLQRVAEEALAITVRNLADKRVGQGAVVVLDNATREVLAYAGSVNFHDRTNGGQNDGVLARRQPGSTLKPFVYAAGFAHAGMTPATLLPDVELRLETASGVYEPHNYDGRFHGPVRLREALGNSYNIPAVWTAERVGPDRVLEMLHHAGFSSLQETADTYGAAIALGDGEVQLLELANAYASLAQGGVLVPVRTDPTPQMSAGTQAPTQVQEGVRIMPELHAAWLTDMLADKSARAAAFGERTVLEFEFDVAAKTGTSKGYRDNWTVGFSSAVTVAVWVGNFDGSPMRGSSGITGAAPIFQRVMAAAMQARPATRLRIAEHTELQQTKICALSGAAATSACSATTTEWLRHDSLSKCNMHAYARIDPRTGLLAPPSCTPQTEQSFEHYVAPFAAWAKSAHRPVAPTEWSPLCTTASGAHQAAADSEPPELSYPAHAARFVLHPDRPASSQRLDVRVHGGLAPLSLLVDGREIGAHQLQWELRQGSHVLAVRDALGRMSAPATVHVAAANR